MALLAGAALAPVGTGVAGCGGSAPISPVAPFTAATPSPTPSPTPTPTPEPTPAAVAPAPAPTPDTCPMLTSWYSTLHNITDKSNKQVARPVSGGHVVVDSTPLFMGRSCNAEHNFCGGRKCEDPRGGDWLLLEGDSPVEVRGDGYQFRIGPLRAGLHRWRVCPHFDAMDALGERVPIGPEPCTVGQFTVE